MAYIKDKTTGLRTVGDVINALQKFPPDMPVGGTLENAIQIYREEPNSGEYYEHDMGQITIEGDDGF